MAWVQELPWSDVDAVLAAWGGAPWCALLDSGGPVEERSRWQVFCHNPRHTVVLQPDGVTIDGIAQPCSSDVDIFDVLRTVFPISEAQETTHLPFCGGWIGFASYALGLMLEGVVSRHGGDPTPLLAAAAYDHAIVWDRQEKRCYVTGLSDRAGVLSGLLQAWDAISQNSLDFPVCPVLDLVPDQTHEMYCQAVSRAREYIAAGDIFQVNITGRFVAHVGAEVSSVALYRQLRQSVPAPFGAYLSCGVGYALLSSSPERFLSVSPAGEIASRPIKGTAPRGATEEEDRTLAEALAVDEKECAENLMIVDLMRHDIGRVARTGSVHVPDFLRVERFSHVHHLVSEIRGQLLPGHDVFDLLRAALPPGSVTGAPKHRALEIIDELEASARGAYCGTLFRIGYDGSMDSSVIIRSFARQQDRLSIGVGGGITILSDPQKEYAEMRLKLAPFSAFVQGGGHALD